MQLHLAGKVTNDAKSLFNGVSITTFALGSAELYRWLDGNDQVAFVPVQVVNDPTVIARNRPFVSVNGALSVDLYGQVVADSIDGKQISGVGGHEDFVAGAELRLDDHSLICLRSTAVVNGETRSRIVPVLPEGSVVSTPAAPHRRGRHRVRGGRPGRAHRPGAGPRPGRDRRSPTSAPSSRRRPRPWAGLTGGGPPAGGRPTSPWPRSTSTWGSTGGGGPYDVVGECRGARRRRPGDAGVVAPRRRRPEHRPAWWPTRLGYDVVAEVGWPAAALRSRRRPPTAGGDPLPATGTPGTPSASTASAGGSAAALGQRRPFGTGTLGLAVLSRVPVHLDRHPALGQLRRDPARRVVISCAPCRSAAAGWSSSGTHMSHIPHGRTPSTGACGPGARHRPAGGAGRRHEPVGPAGQLALPGGLAAGRHGAGPGRRGARTASSTTWWSPRRCRWSTPGWRRPSGSDHRPVGSPSPSAEAPSGPAPDPGDGRPGAVPLASSP